MLNAKPDGYTLTQVAISVLRLPHIQKTPYDPIADLTYIIGVSGYTFGVVVRSDAPWKTWAEFVAYAKANPDKVTYACRARTPASTSRWRTSGSSRTSSGCTCRSRVPPTT